MPVLASLTVAFPHPFLTELAAGRELPSVKDMDALHASAVEHRMTGMLMSCVEDGRLTVPSELARTLAVQSMIVKRQHDQLWSSLASIAELMDGAGIGLATFKGVTSEARWYDRPGERPSSDLDLWVAPHDIGRFAEVVRLLKPDHPQLPHVQEWVDKGFMASIHFEVDEGVWVDIHADLFKVGVANRSASQLWARTEEYELPGSATVRVLDAEGSLLHFLLHFNVDNLALLSRGMDILRVVDRAEVDWGAFDSLTAADGLDVPALMTLAALHEVLALPLPRKRPGGLRMRLWEKMWPESAWLRGGDIREQRLRQRLIPLLAKHRSWEGIRGQMSRAVPPESMLDYYYPEASGPYLVKLVKNRLPAFGTLSARDFD